MTRTHSRKSVWGGHGFSRADTTALINAASAAEPSPGHFSKVNPKTHSKKFQLWRNLLIGLLLLVPISAFAQGCALCYTQAASAGARMIAALRSGILILIIPPTLMSIGMIFVVHHKRNQYRQAGYAASPGPEDGEWQQSR